MNITEWAMKNKNTVLIFSLIIIVTGIYSYFNMGKLKNPSFEIRTALVLTEYPGASAADIERLVTDPLEEAIEEMGTLKHVTSESRTGLSTIFVDIKGSLPPDELPQIWDELRERVADAQDALPTGAGPSEVVDHFGRSYGILLALTGEGFSLRELRQYAKYMQKRLKRCKYAAGVTIFGVQEEQIVIELSRERLAELNIGLADIQQAIQSQNMVTDVGRLNAGDMHIRVEPSGRFQSVDDIKKVVLGGADEALLRLGDIADIERRYVDPPELLFRFNGEPALAIGISTVKGGNTVELGVSVNQALQEIMEELPTGLTISKVNYQSDFVLDTINMFISALLLAVLIVALVLVVSLGLRSAFIISNGLLFNICGTFVIMSALGIDLQCISISSLIIVLGMLVDDSVVVTDNAMVRLEEGNLSSEEACVQAARATGWPQLIATAIAIASFLPMAMAKSATGQFCKTLTYVVAIALATSWIQAMVVVPVMSSRFLKPRKAKKKKAPYSSRFYRSYLGLLRASLRHRWVTVIVVVIIFLLAGSGYGHIKQIFMAMSNRPQYLVDYWLPEGTRIHKTSADLAAIEKELMSWSNIVSVTTTVGGGPPRFMLGFTPEQPNIAYGNMIVRTSPKADVLALVKKTQDFLDSQFPEAISRASGFVTGGSPNFEVQARISGDDPVVLRQLGEQVKQIMANTPGARDVMLDWRNQVPVWKPEYSQAAGNLRGIDREDVVGTMNWLTDGSTWGAFLAADEPIPILVRAPPRQDHDIRDVAIVPVASWDTETTVPLGSVVSDGRVDMENPIICHYDRLRTLTAQCNPAPGVNCAALRTEILKQMHAVDLPRGYHLSWGGLYEESSQSNASVNAQLPLSFGLMLMAVILLFNGVRAPLIIILSLPLSIIGVVAAFLLTGRPMGFLAMFGLYALIGMMIRNAVILIQEMNLLTEGKSGQEQYDGLVHAALTRVRPVLITACTTTLGMLPLLWNYIFANMAVTIIGGLLVATLITLIFIPVLYSLFFRIKPHSLPL